MLRRRIGELHEYTRRSQAPSAARGKAYIPRFGAIEADIAPAISMHLLPVCWTGCDVVIGVVVRVGLGCGQAKVSIGPKTSPYERKTDHCHPASLELIHAHFVTGPSTVGFCCLIARIPVQYIRDKNRCGVSGQSGAAFVKIEKRQQ